MVACSMAYCPAFAYSCSCNKWAERNGCPAQVGSERRFEGDSRSRWQPLRLFAASRLRSRCAPTALWCHTGRELDAGLGREPRVGRVASTFPTS